MEAQETKFKHGDIVKIRTSGEKVMVIEYKINHVGGVMNSLYGTDKFKESVITDDVLCEGTIDKKFQRRYIKEANLELVQD